VIVRRRILEWEDHTRDTFLSILNKMIVTHFHLLILLLDSSYHIWSIIGPIYLFIVLNVQLFGELAILLSHLLCFAFLKCQFLFQHVYLLFQLHILFHKLFSLLVVSWLRGFKPIIFFSEKAQLGWHFVAISFSGKNTTVHVLDKINFVSIFMRVSRWGPYTIVANLGTGSPYTAILILVDGHSPASVK